MQRREPATILALHRLDPERRDLYVEGRNDFLFLRLLAGLDQVGSAKVLEIDTVDLPEITEGGNRERVVAFAALVEHSGASIKGLVDADNDRVIPRTLPSSLWLTDGRDLESYFLRVDCFAKMGLAVGLGAAACEELLGRVIDVGRHVASLRVISAREQLRLPFQDTEIRRSLNATRDELSLDIRKYTTTLLQKANLNVRDAGDICVSAEAARNETENEEDMVVVAGRDAMAILDVALRKLPGGSDSRVLRATFEQSMVADYPNLRQVVSYIRKAEA